MRNLLLVFVWAFLLSCKTPAKEREAQASGPGNQAAPAKAPPAALSISAAATTAPPAASPSPSASTPALPTSATGSAYFGCGEPIPVERLWDEATEGEVLEAISAAKKCASSQQRKLLLEFVAPWCGDCREMARLDEAPIVSETRRKRFERVRINVGKWDRHEALRDNYRVRALATYIVIDPKTSQVLTQTTLEPVSKKQGKKLTAEDWAAWLASN